MRRILLVLVTLSLTSASTIAFAEKRLSVCAEYLGSGKKYRVEAVEISGTELNSATNSFSYNSFSTYAVIFWSQNQASVIELDGIGGISYFGQTGTDQNGGSWEITRGNSMCF